MKQDISECFLAIALADGIEPTALEIIIAPGESVIGSSAMLTEVSVRHHIPHGYISFIRLDGLPYYAWGEDKLDKQENNFLHGLSGARQTEMTLGVTEGDGSDPFSVSEMDYQIRKMEAEVQIGLRCSLCLHPKANHYYPADAAYATPGAVRWCCDRCYGFSSGAPDAKMHHCGLCGQPTIYGPCLDCRKELENDLRGCSVPMDAEKDVEI